MELTRERLLEALRETLEPRDDVHAMWEGGGIAHGRIDEWSDIDLQLDAPPDRIEEVFEALEACLDDLGGIALCWKVPEPTWHGHSQRFYRLNEASEFLLLDAVIMKRTAERRFREVERHGEARIHFDKLDIIRNERVDAVELRDQLSERVEELRTRFPLFQCLTKKELNRGQDLEAVGFYHGHTLRPLVELLRIRHAPHRWDFHTRYVHHDLPADVLDRLRQLFFVRDGDELSRRRVEAEAWFEEELAQLDADGVRV